MFSKGHVQYVLKLADKLEQDEDPTTLKFRRASVQKVFHNMG